MKRLSGLLNLAQAGIYVALGVYLGQRWLPAGLAFYLAAAAQLGAGAWLLWKRDPRGVRWASWLGLLVSALVTALHLQVAVHIIQTFTPVGAETGWSTLGGLAVALPWAVLLPTVQLVQLWDDRPTKADLGAGAAVALGLLLPPLWSALQSRPDQEYAALDGEQVAAWMFTRWTTEARAEKPTGPGPVAIVATVVKDGAVLETRTFEGDTLEETLGRFRLVNQHKEGQALYVDFALREYEPYEPLLLATRGPSIARPARSGLRHDNGIHGSLVSWREPAVTHRSVAPGFLGVPAIQRSKLGGGSSTLDFQTFLVSEEDGVVPVQDTWAAPPDLSADSALDAALQGALFIAKNQEESGRYTYILKGPSGEKGGGYNYPRHAGATWYLARVYSATGDEDVYQAAIRGMHYLIEHSKLTDDGRAHIHDPKRKDGKAWVGTTALALAAFTELGAFPEWQQRYADFVASSVDERGSVRGDMTVETGVFPTQDEVTYAQGQGLLALALAERAGLTGVSEPLDRAIAYVEGDYWPLPAARFKTLDEHWMCLASAAVHSQRGQAAGIDICTAYLADVRDRDPVPGSGIQPAAGPGAGLAEAVIARAELDRRMGHEGPYLQRSLDYGELLLANLYQPTDRPLLGTPALIGGFRDKPWSLDVQVDAVQHIGCALLGVEQLLRGEELPGRMP